MADSTGRELTYGQALTASLLVARWMQRERRDEEMIGVLLPPSVGGALANIGITLAGKVPVNLNFTAGREAMASAIEQCGIRTVVTSKVFLAKAKLDTIDGHGLHRRHSRARRQGRQIPARSLAARLAPARLLTSKHDAGFAGDRDLLERQHRRAQGRDALALQRDLQYRSHGAGLLDRPERPHRRRAAVLPLLRLHGHHLVPAGRRLRRGLPSQSDGRQSDRRPGGQVSRHIPALHADVLRDLHAQVRRRRVRRPALRPGRRGETARVGRRRVPARSST